MSQEATANQARDALRSRLRAARNALSLAEIQSRSESICKRVIPLLSDQTHIASYVAFGAEVDLIPLLASFSQNKQQCYVPMVLPQFQMAFAPVDKNTEYTENQYGIKEPQVEPSLYKQASDIDAVLVPLVGFDKQCNRMGMGGGYYDRCFAHRKNTKTSPLLIGVAFEVQHANSVYAQSWDVPLDMVVTETRVVQR